jgi:hypothetical protein
MLGHIMGIPVEEDLPMLAAAGAALSVAAVAGRARLRRMLNRLRRLR